MNARILNIVKYQSKNLNQIIDSKYSASYLNNTKWDKLILGLAEELDQFYVKVKLVYDDVIEGYLLDNVDMNPYFNEPITYREVEWIEFTSEYENYVNYNNKKAEYKTVIQDLEKINSTINKIRKFKIEVLKNSLRLYAYQVKN